MTAVSRESGFIYVRVPRTGSETFSRILSEQFPGEILNTGGMHSPARDIRKNHPDIWEEYYTFGFIRNPWAWFVSMYDAGIWQGAFGNEVWAGARVEPCDNPFIEPGECMGMKFGDWLRKRKTTPIDWLSDGGIIVDRVYLFEDFIRGTSVHEHKRSDNRPHYREYYTPELRDYVRDKCRREIEIGNYQF